MPFNPIATLTLLLVCQTSLGAAPVVANDPGTRMVAAAHKLMAQVKDNHYSFTCDIEPAKGVFHADCSQLVDYLAGEVNPAAVADLPRDAGHPEPRADNLYDYLHARPLIDPARPLPVGHWGRVGRPAELLPGDVIVWKNEHYVPHKSSTGHVMLVAATPQPVRQGQRILGYDVPVIDATAHGHGPGDNRTAGRSGLGQGTIYLPTDAAGIVTGFSWTPANTPGGKPPRPPVLAFGRLLVAGR